MSPPCANLLDILPLLVLSGESIVRRLHSFQQRSINVRKTEVKTVNTFILLNTLLTSSTIIYFRKNVKDKIQEFLLF